MTPKILPLSFSKNNTLYTQIYRDNKYCIYTSQRNGHHNIFFEVFKIKAHNGFTLGGQYIEPAETYPSNNDFGRWAWSCMSEARAKEKIKELESNKENQKQEKIEVPAIKHHVGRPVVWKQCVKCGKGVQTKIFAKNKGRCDECLTISVDNPVV